MLSSHVIAVAPEEALRNLAETPFEIALVSVIVNMCPGLLCAHI